MINYIKKLIDADYKHYQYVLKLAKKIDALKEEIHSLSNDELIEIHHKLNKGNPTLSDNDIVLGVALIREITYRTVGLFPYFVQLIGGLILYFNDIAEMKTGEGKTLTSIIPIYLKSLEGKLIHVVTTNEYLSQRDYMYLLPVYDFLGIHAGLNRREMNRANKQQVYRNQVVYTTNSELGFDYLRDSFVMSSYDKVVSRFDYALIDEVDSILIDEARTPLIISGSNNEDMSEYQRCQSFVDSLHDIDIIHDIETRSVYLSESGIQKAHSFFQMNNLYNPDNMPLVHKMNQALKANYIFKKDVDYVVQNNEVLIVDEYTGRILPGREYSEGLHQAIQAKEKVEIKPENSTEATITYQNLFRLYNELAGMSGTAKTEEIELFTTYNLRTFVVPTNQPNIRKDDKDATFATIKEKANAIIEDAIEFMKKGNPVLIGTTSIQDSLMLSRMLTAKKINHVVLNGTQNEDEADIVSKAGQSGRITIATNIAGRGTDIPLDEKAKVCGGLCILGFQRHDSQRIDNQLKGRAARQGDPGFTRMYVSLEDILIVKNANDEQKQKLYRKLKHNQSIQSLVNLIQKQAENNNYNTRKHLLEYDNELSMHRKIIFELRDSLLEISNLHKELSYALHLYFSNKVQSFTTEELFNEWQKTLKPSYKLKINYSNKDEMEDMLRIVENKVIHDIDANLSYSLEIVQKMMLTNLNYVWKKHVDNMVELKKGIEYNSLIGKKPIDVYKEEAYKLFRNMWNNYYESIGNMLLTEAKEEME